MESRDSQMMEEYIRKQESMINELRIENEKMKDQMRIERQQIEDEKKLINDEKEKISQEKKNYLHKYLNNFNLFDVHIPGANTIKFGKYLDKRLDLEHEFRRLIYSVERNISELLYLFPDMTGQEYINNQIKSLINTFKIIINDFMKELKITQKMEIIENFYQKNSLKELQKSLIDNFYPLVKEIPNEFPLIDNLSKRSLFQDFDPSKNNGNIDFEKFKLIDPPDNYSIYINDEEKIEEYDKFVSVSNLIISLRVLQTFEDKYKKTINECYKQEVLLTKEQINEFNKEEIALYFDYITNMLHEENISLKQQNKQIQIKYIQAIEFKVKKIQEIMKNISEIALELDQNNQQSINIQTESLMNFDHQQFNQICNFLNDDSDLISEIHNFDDDDSKLNDQLNNIIQLKNLVKNKVNEINKKEQESINKIKKLEIEYQKLQRNFNEELERINQIKRNEIERLNQLTENVSILNHQAQDLEQKNKELEQNIINLQIKKSNFTKEFNANCNEFAQYLNEAQNKEKKIHLMLHDRKKIFLEDNKEEEEEQNIENYQIQPNTVNINIMNKIQKEEYFNYLVNQNEFTISIHDFYNLTHEIKSVNEKQFEFMINYYNYKQSKGEKDNKIIFINLDNINIEMLQKLLNLEDFTFDFLSKNAMKNIMNRALMYDSLFNDIGDLFFLNEKIIYDPKIFENNENLRDNLLRKSKKKYYLIYNNINNEIRFKKGTTCIENNFFNGYKIEKIFIPSSVIEIQNNAFYQCSNLTTVSFEGLNLKTIGKSAFSGCVNLKSLIIPDEVRIIEESTFEGCEKLEKILFPKKLEEIKEKAFYKCKSLVEVKLPNTIKKLGKGAFGKCKALKIVIIPGILLIHSSEEFQQLNEIFKISSSIDNFCISSKCFFKCREIQNVIISEKCQLIDNSAFYSCSKLENVKMSLSKNSKIGNSCFMQCEQMKTVYFVVSKDSSLEIDNFAFSFCRELEMFKFDKPELFNKNSLKINSGVFSNCEQLSNFSFPENCQNEIGSSCFENCSNLTSVRLPINTTKISKAMFKNCKKLISIDLRKEMLISIEDEAFENCTNLKLENLPENLLKIGDKAFKKCISLKFVSFPLKIEDIGQKAFENCIGFVEIEIPASMKIIHKKAFKDCSELVKVINNSLEVVIEKKAFENCIKLKEIFTIQKNEFSSEAFKNCACGMDFFKIES